MHSEFCGVGKRCRAETVVGSTCPWVTETNVRELELFGVRHRGDTTRDDKGREVARSVPSETWTKPAATQTQRTMY